MASSYVKESLKCDPRYKSVKHEDREKLFNEYVAELKAAEEETVRKAKAKQDEEVIELLPTFKIANSVLIMRVYFLFALGETEGKRKSSTQEKEREEQEVERVRQKARRKEALESYQALLVETIKDPQASWTESKPKLEKDPQGRAANPHLDKSDLEKLFREHVKTLYERCAVEFKALLMEVITADAAAQEAQDGKTPITSWSTAKQLLKNDPRYNKMPRKERESLWRRHADEIQRKQKKVHDQEGEKPAEGKSRTSVDSGKHLSGWRRAHDRR
ncbi:Pre-processing protein 40C [Sesamum angolense]|uniref:Pre-processing protein 40C n=1 Tax=Sesamum angolense TaxID=2727404 RepID=A0AAE1W7H6_9LAMI|nr:Pre-processing protein 40C [Sesamum angolense]